MFVQSQYSYNRNRKFDFVNHDYFSMEVLQNIGGYEGCSGRRTGGRGGQESNSPVNHPSYIARYALLETMIQDDLNEF